MINKTPRLVWMVAIAGGIFGSNQGTAEESATALTSVERKSPVFVERTTDPHARVAFWLESSLKRVFPTSPVGDSGSLKLLSARNARLSFQACYRNESTRAVTVDCCIAAPEGIEATVRRVGYVPMWNHTAQVPPEERDSFVVYPGQSGPIDSIRWEVFAESMQDYALLQTAGISPDDPLLDPLKDYADFPKSAEWITRVMETILAGQ